ncbi:MAG: PAS domain S-box protein, partial [Moraxellaceae bacterium]
MAYNTAICIFLAGMSLLGLLREQFLLVKICATTTAVLSGLTLIELLSGIGFSVNYWFISKPKNIMMGGGLMSPTTALCLLVVSISLILFRSPKNSYVIPIVFLNLISLTITLIAILGHGIGLVPAFVWLGIKMSPHTAMALSFLSLAIIIYIYDSALDTFNQLNFFNRIVAGFGFMAILVVAIGSIAFMQIHTVSSITHELYEKPLQISNAAQRIKTEINIINRQLKNIAIQRESASTFDIPQQLNISEQRIAMDVEFIQKSNPLLKKTLQSLTTDFNAWKKYTLESWRFIEAKDFEQYSLRTVYEGQEYILAIEDILENISAQAQESITDLNTSVARTEEEARQLVIVIVTGFLLMGLAVASLITRSLTFQLQQIRRTMLAIAHEKLTTPIPFLDHTQEIGDMARALGVFQDSFAARRHLETRLLQVIEAMPNGVIMVNDGGVIEIINAQAEKIFGYARSELLGKKIEQLIPLEVAKSHSHNRDSFFNNPSTRIMGAGRELFGLRRDGEEFPLEIGLAPVDTKEGMKVLASIVDITERCNANRALNESRERLELTTRVNQIGIWEYIVDEEKLIWNDAMFEIYGRNKNYFTRDYNAWKQCIHPIDLKETEKLFKDSIEKVEPFSCKFRIIQPDGTIKYLQAKAKIERDSTNALRMLGTNIDVTREELALAKLHDIEVLRSAIVEFSEDAIISKTPTGIITSWNSGAVNMFGYSVEEAVGKPIKDLLFPHDLIHEEEALLAQVRTGLVIKHFETLRRCKDGRFINVSISLSPIKNSDNNVIGISAIKRDITDSIETAKMLSLRKVELERSNHDLERSNKELETFAYVASHDLKSPLRGIAQLSTWIEEDLAANEISAVVEHTSLLRNRIQRMEKLLDDLLIFYRAGKAEGVVMDVNVNQMVGDIFEIQN